MKPCISVIIPAHNEVKTIENCIKAVDKSLREITDRYEIIVVDDHSTDGTYRQARDMKKSVNEIYSTGNQDIPGKGSALRWGIEKSDYDYIVTIDADLQVNPSEIKTFLKALEHHNADAVIGNKRHPYSNVSYTPARWIISNGYNLMTRILFGFSLRDSQCGLKLFRAEPLKSVISRVLVKQFAYDIEILIALRNNGYRVADAPIRLSQQYNAGSISGGSIYETAKDTLAVWWRWKRGWYKT